MKKSKGLTASEEYVARLCGQTFLDLWSYPNIFRDVGAPDLDGKEVCDLLAVCGNNVLIFSVKDCELKQAGDIEKNWKRWYKRAIVKSASQIYGAERWIRQHPDRLFLDTKCKNAFPFITCIRGEMKVHRIAVALGARDACRKFYGGGSGSLIVEGGTSTDGNSDFPFSVTQPNPNAGFIHILDEIGLNVVLNELNTISDCIDYLEKKESLFQTKDFVLSTGEEELLGYYFTHYESAKGGYGFHVPDDVSGIAFEEGLFEKLVNHPQYAQRQSANRISYLWDRIINTFGKHARKGELIDGSLESIDEVEQALRIMALETRGSRRGLSEALHTLIETL